jgi:hypothetical protein
MSRSGGYSTVWVWCCALFLASFALVSCGGETESTVGKTDANVVFQKTITLAAPKNVPVLSPVLEASNSLVLGAGSDVLPSNLIVAMGSGGTRAEPDAQANTLWSRGLADLKDRVHLRGGLNAVNLTRGNNVTIDGPINRNPVFDPTTTLSWTVTFPTTTPTNLALDDAESVTISPGNYGLLRAGEDSTLTLRAGTYYVTDLQFDTDATIELDQSAGPVILWVSNTIIVRSNIVSLDGTPPEILLGFLGTNNVFVEVAFQGVILSPFSTVVLRNRAPQHTGFFAGKGIELDAHAKVGYRFPLPVIPAAGLPEATCRSLVPLRTDLSGPAQEEAYVRDLARYCGVCRLLNDSDLDGKKDCLDGCPYDKLKTQPGACGCGVSDINEDNDAYPACIDKCDKDPDNIDIGDCGCDGTSTLKPAGYPCLDKFCPTQTGATCDGSGVCGNRNSCRPSGDCFPIMSGANIFWICGKPNGGTPATPRSWPTATTTCASKGMILARVDTFEQNQLIRGVLKSLNLNSAWIGANSRAATNVWRWAKTGSDSGDQFWQGGASGTKVNGRFNSWALSEPGTQRCGAFQSSDGRWIDNDCNQALPYVCQFDPGDRTRIPPKPPIPGQPPTYGSGGAGSGGSGGGGGVPPCVPEYSGPAPLPDEAHLSDLLTAYNDSASMNTHGAAQNPPNAPSYCPHDLKSEVCPLTDVRDTVPCVENQDCINAHGAGFICTSLQTDPACLGTPSAPCAAKVVCGIPACVPDGVPNRCDQYDVCPGPGVVYTAVKDPESVLDPTPPQPADFFDSPPDQTQSPQFVDEPANSGPAHTWCHLVPQDTGKVENADQAMMNHGQSGKNTPILFQFFPDLIFDAQPNPLAFGETEMHLHARAGLTAHVKLTGFMGKDYEADIFRAIADIRAERCQFSTADTELTVAGLDVLSLAGGYIPTIDTADETLAGTTAYEAAKTCQESVNGFINKANRIKKAFRDAQQLLKQYNTIKDGGGRFPDDWCTQIGVEDLVAQSGFPMAGICPEGEPPELTINRFVDYYQSPEFGELLGINGAATALNGATSGLRTAIAQKLNGILGATNIELPIADFKRSETQTILNAPFFIGPLPMTIQISAVAGYGIYGGFSANLALPTDLMASRGNLSNPASPQPEQLARVSAQVEPWASAGLTLFVGAGFNAFGMEASVGIEGGLTLARIGAPLSAGVGIGVATTPDTRPIPTEIQQVSELVGGLPSFPFKSPQAYQFFLSYDFGAKILLTDVLSGYVAGKLRIKFFFFSRTWRKKIVEFTGWSLAIPLISESANTGPFTVPGGSSAEKATGNTGMGRSESQLPFTFLKRLIAPEHNGVPEADAGAGGEGGSGSGGTGGTGGVGSVDKTKVEAFGYDQLCCSKETQSCSETGRPEPPCCPGLVCNTGVCEPTPVECAGPSEPCGYDDVLRIDIACCSGAACPKTGKCPSCGVDYDECGEGIGGCCDGYYCSSYGCLPDYDPPT